MDEIDAMKAIAEKMELLSDEERARVLNWAASKYGFGANGVPTPTPIVHKVPQENTTAVEQDSPKAAKATKPKASKKAKSIISMDKSLNLSPSGKVSAIEFAASKSPANVKQKCVVAVYYLRDTIGMENVTVAAVFTFFKNLSWPVPADLKNTLQQAGTEGWLDTKDSDNIQLTSIGENLVEHSLPPKPKA